MTPSRRDFIRHTVATGAVLGVGGALAGCRLSRSRGHPPNVILVFTDDQGYGDVGAYGAEGFATPHLDRLAAEGMRFTDFYASQAVCSASRASLLTGCYAERVSIRGALGPRAAVGLNPDETTIAEMLKPLGYATGIFGKWHLGDAVEFLPLQHGFDEYFGLPYSNDMWPVDYDGNPVLTGGKAAYPPLPLIEGNDVLETVDELSDQDLLTSRYAARAVDFIDRHAEEPFFLYLAHTMPHVPLGVSDRFRGSSEQGMYGDVIAEIDWSVGLLLEALDRHDLSDDTLVIFTSDNGPWLNYGNHAGSTGGLREGKGTAFEGGPRVPAIVRWPGRVEPGAVCDGLASTIDVLPTVAAVTGAALPSRTIDGVDILPLLLGDDASPRTVFLYYFGGELRGVREGRWKRVFEHVTRSYEDVEPSHDGHPGPYASPAPRVPDALYDLETDVAETTDVAPDNPDVVARLDAIAEEARATLGDRLTDREGSEVRPLGRVQFDRPETVSHLALGAAVTLAYPPNERYSGNGAEGLTDGRLGTRDFADRRWLGFRDTPLDATVDLGAPRSVGLIGASFMQNQQPWIFFPQSVVFSVSPDGVTWQDVGRVEQPAARRGDAEVQTISTDIRVDGVRYVRVVAHAVDPLPEWHAGAGDPAWVFVDEIIVEG